MHRRLLHASTRRQEEEEDGSLQCLCFPTVLASCKAVSSASMFYLKIGSREGLNLKKILHIIIGKQSKNYHMYIPITREESIIKNK